MIVLGNSRAGKSTFTTKLLLNDDYKFMKHFDRENIILISPNAHSDKIWV